MPMAIKTGANFLWLLSIRHTWGNRYNLTQFFV